MRSDISELFKAWKLERGDKSRDKLFAGFKTDRGAKMLRRDLEAVGIAYKCPDTGRFADFHASRHTFIANLTRNGVNLHVAQKLARHSTITLTVDRYSHVEHSESRLALDVLPELVGARGYNGLNDGTTVYNLGQKTDTKTDCKLAKTGTKTDCTAYSVSQLMSSEVGEVGGLDESSDVRKSLLDKEKGRCQSLTDNAL